MKLQGKTLTGPSVRVIPIVRSETNQDDNFYFTAKAVLDYTAFDKLCPMPKPPEMILPGGERKLNVEHPQFKVKLVEWNTLRTHWMILQSIAETPGLEFSTVKPDEPATWPNYETEMRASGLSEAEIARVITGVIDANGLDDSKIDEARKHFLQLVAGSKAG